MKDLQEFRLLSTRQIQRLRFDRHISVSSATRTTTRVLGRLEGHGLLARLERRVGGTLRGSAATVWQLASSGERLLRHLAGEGGRQRYIEPSSPFTSHTLAVADLAVSLTEASREGRTDLLEVVTEPDCWRPFTNSAGGTEKLRPDLYVVTADKRYETHSFVEMDLGSEHLPTLIRKCAVYQRYFQSGTEQSQLDLFPSVVWLISSEGRAAKLRAAIDGDSTLTSTLFQVALRDEALTLLAPSDMTTTIT